jgi:hypothetical protein
MHLRKVLLRHVRWAQQGRKKYGEATERLRQGPNNAPIDLVSPYVHRRNAKFRDGSGSREVVICLRVLETKMTQTILKRIQDTRSANLWSYLVGI